ncbi:MAG: hypothetical protein M3114_09600, partial [Thermoproteota archaeon]|nr:hypothetical protein [Thermoproteota archaeon]
DESKRDVKHMTAGSQLHSANFAVRRFCGGILGAEESETIKRFFLQGTLISLGKGLQVFSSAFLLLLSYFLLLSVLII